MPAAAELYGFNLFMVMAAARAAPLGRQKDLYAGEVCRLLGDSPLFEIRVGALSTLVYSSSVLGPLTASSGGIPMPPQLNEPPVVNVVNSLDASQAAVLILKNRTNQSIYLRVPLQVGGGTETLTASKGLDGTSSVKFENLILAAPATLDSGTGGALTMPLSELIADMAGVSVQPGFGTHEVPESVIQMPCNHQAIISACNFAGTSRSTFDSYWNAATSLFWCYYAPGNSRFDKRLQFRNLAMSVLRSSNNTWFNVPIHNKQSMAQMWYGNTPTVDLTGQTYQENVRNEADGCSVLLTRSDMGAECWPASFYAWIDRTLAADAKCLVAFTQVRVIDNTSAGQTIVPYTGNDAKFSVRLGYDLYFSGQSSAPGTAGLYGKHGSAGGNADGEWAAAYPRFLAEGGNGRWKTIDGSMGWVNVGVIGGYAGTYRQIGAPAPWGNGETPSWPYNKSPFSLTQAELEANPPTFASAPVAPPPSPAGDIFKMSTLADDMVMPNDSLWHIKAAPFTANTFGPTRPVYGQTYAYIYIARNRYQYGGYYQYGDEYLQKSWGTNSTPVNLLGWYVVGEAAQAENTAPNTRVHLRNYVIWCLNADRTWTKIQPGANYFSQGSCAWHANFSSPGNETFEDVVAGAANTTVGYHARREPDGGESLGHMGYFGTREGFAAHGYPTGQTQAKSYWAGLLGIAYVMEGRLILNDPNVADDRANANQVIYMGADWRPNTGSGHFWIGEHGHGRVKRLTNNWQIFSFTDLTRDQLTANPIPGYS